MRLDEFSYDLPESLIAQHPTPERTGSRLMVVDRASGDRVDARFADLPQHLHPGDLVVVNRSRVVPARVLVRRRGGARVEVLFVRALEDGRFRAWVRPLARLVPDEPLLADDGEPLFRFLGAAGGREAVLCVEPGRGEDVEAVLERYGHVPLPPYIQRPDETGDRERYQTVFAREPGSVAAPTAGLHFDAALVSDLARRGVDVVSITLHVGPGTFQPLDEPVVEDNRLEAEAFTLDAPAREALAAARATGRRVVAVGTTVTRALETAARRGWLDPGRADAGRSLAGETDLFITPGFEFRVVDCLITNFHLPRSSLLLLVCAFLGRERTLDCYRHAVATGYRFYSYGDAMLISGSDAGPPPHPDAA